ncbi:MAG: LysM peptidoglycan-binding domain-containing protein [Candidatus Brocadia sp.]|nr:LysM peptidoglycan-binding domain-containing protein [Candidatus Brocadia sp.]
MKRDVQVGVTLGVIILAIIGVFLSTRTSVKEPAIPIPDEEEETQSGVLDISQLSPDTQNASQESLEETKAALKGTEESTTQKTSIVADTTKIEEQTAEKEDNIVEGEWQKAKEKEPVNVTANDTKASVTNQEDWKDVSYSDGKTTSKFRMHKVKYSDSLRKIARKYYGDESKWLLIFNANQDKIQDRNSIRIGTELIIPEEKTKTEITTPTLSQVVEMEDAKQTVRKHIIQQGDSLYTLATKYYNDGTKWSKIFNANRKVLKDQKSLKIGQELVIPDL